MAFPAEKIIELIKAQIPDAEIDLRDTVGDQNHYAAIVTSSQFEGLSRVKRQMIVYKSLGSYMGNELHALSLKTLTPAERESL